MITFPPEVPFYCMACRTEHPAAWTYRGGCYAADGWYEGNFDGDDVSEAAWKEFARMAIYREDISRMTFTVTHDCGCQTQEYSARPKTVCPWCAKQRKDDRYEN